MVPRRLRREHRMLHLHNFHQSDIKDGDRLEKILKQKQEYTIAFTREERCRNRGMEAELQHVERESF